jgi:hypothetical protein
MSIYFCVVTYLKHLTSNNSYRCGILKYTKYIEVLIDLFHGIIIYLTFNT